MINVVTFAGHLGSEPESRRAGEKIVTSARLALSQGKERPTIWLDLDAWEGSWAQKDLAKLRKGTRVTVTGRLTLREYVTKAGEQRQALGVNVQGIEAPRSEQPQAAAPQASPQDAIPW